MNSKDKNYKKAEERIIDSLLNELNRINTKHDNVFIKQLFNKIKNKDRISLLQKIKYFGININRKIKISGNNFSNKFQFQILSFVSLIFIAFFFVYFYNSNNLNFINKDKLIVSKIIKKVFINNKIYKNINEKAIKIKKNDNFITGRDSGVLITDKKNIFIKTGENTEIKFLSNNRFENKNGKINKLFIKKGTVSLDVKKQSDENLIIKTDRLNINIKKGNAFLLKSENFTYFEVNSGKIHIFDKASKKFFTIKKNFCLIVKNSTNKPIVLNKKCVFNPLENKIFITNNISKYKYVSYNIIMYNKVNLEYLFNDNIIDICLNNNK